MRKAVLWAVPVAALALVGPVYGRADHSSGSDSAACNNGTVTADPATLWPPNHRLQTITLTYVGNDDDYTRLTIDAITHDQIVDGEELVGSGNPSLVDIEGVGATDDGGADDPAAVEVGVRAERSGTDQTGRVYTINFTCEDFVDDTRMVHDITEGNPPGSGTEMGSVQVYVPHDMGGGNGG